MNSLPALIAVNPVALLEDNSWRSLRECQREEAERRLDLIRPGLQKLAAGCDVAVVARWLETLGHNLPSFPTLQRYLSAYKKRGIAGLAPAYEGRVRSSYGWEARALRYYQMPSKPCISTIARWLRETDQFEDASDSRVRRYLDSLPANVGEFSASRVGPHHRAQNLKPYKRRDSSTIPPGLIWTGDGHCLDWYTKHHNNGHHHRYELTPWLDIGSKYCVGFWLDEREHGLGTLYSLGTCISAHDHVPAMLHVDPGPGFKNRMVTGESNKARRKAIALRQSAPGSYELAPRDKARAEMIQEVQSFAGRIGPEFMFALPGNAKGKGFMERWFGVMEERLGKRFESYCGKTMPQEFMRRFEQRIAKGLVRLPTLDETRQAIAEYIHRYNNTPLDALGGKTPAELWARREKNPLHLPPDVLMRPRETRKATRYGVSLFNRLYRHPQLAAYEGRDVLVEYDIHNDSAVRLLTLDGRYIATAELSERQPWLPESRVKELEQKRLRDQLRRLDDKREEMEARQRESITAEQSAMALEEFGALDLPALPKEKADGAGPSIDLTDTDY